MPRLGMVIDLKRCVGCHGCTAACKAEHATMPGIFWGKVLEKEVGKFPTARRTFIPVLCNHCKDPACERACPTGATHKRDDGIVLVDYDKCVGCRACMMACPYGARYYPNEWKRYFEAGLTPFEERGYAQYQIGVVQKCTLCAERVDRGLEPACSQTCPAKARTFGDLDDPTSEVSRLIVERGGQQLQPDLGTDPSVYYLL